MDGITGLADGIKKELQRLLPKQRKTQRDKLSLRVATMLDVRRANLMDLASLILTDWPPACPATWTASGLKGNAEGGTCATNGFRGLWRIPGSIPTR